MDGLTQTTIQTDALLARFRAERSTKRSGADGARAYQSATDSKSVANTVNRANSVDRAELVDRVEISVSSTSATVNGVLNDSVVEQINRSIQEAGIDLKIEAGGSFEVSPEGTARRIADFATSHHGAYSQARASEPEAIRLEGFMSLIRGAIEEGFAEAKDFLSGITKMSDTLNETIDRTLELTKGYLSDFEAVQRAAVTQQDEQTPADESQTGVEL